MVRLLVCLLLSVATGAAVYLGGAVVWSLIDPQGAGVPLLFTIPLAIAAVAIPALIGVIGLINRGEACFGLPRGTRMGVKAIARVAARPSPARRPVQIKSKRPKTSPPPKPAFTSNDEYLMELGSPR